MRANDHWTSRFYRTPFPEMLSNFRFPKYFFPEIPFPGQTKSSRRKGNHNLAIQQLRTHSPPGDKRSQKSDIARDQSCWLRCEDGSIPRCSAIFSKEASQSCVVPVEDGFAGCSELDCRPHCDHPTLDRSREESATRRVGVSRNLWLKTASARGG